MILFLFTIVHPVFEVSKHCLDTSSRFSRRSLVKSRLVLLQIDAEYFGDLRENAVDVGIEDGAFLLVLADEVCGRKNLLLLVREAAEVEIVVPFRQFCCRESAGLVRAVQRQLLPVIPPFDDGGEMLRLHRLGLGEVFVAFRHIQTIEPCLLRRSSMVEEEQIGGDGGVRGEDAVGKPDDRVQVEL